MNTIYLKRIFLSLIIICFSVFVNAQKKTPANYVGVSGIGELNRLAVSAGVEYERWLYTKNQFALGAKVHYIFPSKTINYLFSSNEPLQKNSQTHIMATTYFFTGSEKETKGFFLSFGIGANFIKWWQESSDQSGNHYISTYSEVSPGFDISIGTQLKISDQKAFRITGGYESFLADKYKELVNGNNVALLYTKISLGFL
jgi:hypothetical protein